jgi:hypothetical protein
MGGCIPDLKLDSRRVVEADGLCQKGSYATKNERTKKCRDVEEVLPVGLVSVAFFILVQSEYLLSSAEHPKDSCRH